jgi:L-2-hydroxyglutarate oxidase LhgO
MLSNYTAASNHFQTIVIGAGVVGLAIARRFAMGGCEVLLLEKESSIGQGISSRSSEVIHSGIYYPPSSLKAKLCVQGKDMLYNYCSTRNIPYKKIGKLIVATNEKQRDVDLPNLLQRGKENQLHDLTVLSPEQVTNEYEPEITCHGAIYSPSTGIVDSHALMMTLLAE